MSDCKKQTEREVIESAVKRIGQFIDWGNQIDKNTIEVDGYYSMRFTFDDDGNLLEIDSHP